MDTKDNLEDINEISELSLPINFEEYCKFKSTPSRDMNHPRLSNRRATELPSKQLDLYLKGKTRHNSIPCTPPPSQMSPTEEEKKYRKRNRRRLSTPAFNFSHQPIQGSFSTIAESLNRLAIGNHCLTIGSECEETYITHIFKCEPIKVQCIK